MSLHPVRYSCTPFYFWHRPSDLAAKSAQSLRQAHGSFLRKKPCSSLVFIVSAIIGSGAGHSGQVHLPHPVRLVGSNYILEEVAVTVSDEDDGAAVAPQGCDSWRHSGRRCWPRRERGRSDGARSRQQRCCPGFRSTTRRRTTRSWSRRGCLVVGEWLVWRTMELWQRLRPMVVAGNLELGT